MKKVYIICAHINEVTIPEEAFLDEEKAAARLEYLRANAVRGVGYSLQYAPLKDGEK